MRRCEKMSDVRGCEKISHVRRSFICRSIYTSFFLKNPLLRRSREKDRWFWAPSAPREVAFGAGKQHGLAGSRRPFLDLTVPELRCQPSRPKPIKI